MKPLQLNGTYYVQEDRIMLRIKTENNTEYRFWLTRLITKNICDIIEKISIKNITGQNKSKSLSQGVIQAIDDMQQQAIENETDLTQSYKGANKLPLGGDPVLILDLAFTIHSPSLIRIKYTLKNQANIEFEFNMATLARVRLLLNQLANKGRWDLNQPSNKTDLEQIPLKHSIH